MIVRYGASASFMAALQYFLSKHVSSLSLSMFSDVFNATLEFCVDCLSMFGGLLSLIKKTIVIKWEDDD